MVKVAACQQVLTDDALVSGSCGICPVPIMAFMAPILFCCSLRFHQNASAVAQVTADKLRHQYGLDDLIWGHPAFLT